MPQVRLLGPVDVIDDNGASHAPGSPLRRTILSLLALRGRTVLNAERLLDVAWDGGPPGSGRRALHFHISRLRAELGIDDLIVTVGSGYRLEADVDVDDVVIALEQPDDIDRLATSLARWRGEPLLGTSPCIALDHERRRLDELRLAAAERLHRARVQSGDTDVIADLDRLCLDHPVRESLWAILVTAQYRAGNQADALRSLTTLRLNLRDELGVDPSTEIRDLELRVLEHDPSLRHPEVATQGPGDRTDRMGNRLARPETHFARVGKLRIAYQEFGAGERTVLVPPLTSNVDVFWDHEFYRRMLDHLGTHLHVVQFDKRGVGVSDRFDGRPTVDDRISDIATVMDAVGWERANLFGLSEGASMAQLFAVRHPERVDKLALLGDRAPPSAVERAKVLSGPAHRDTADVIAEMLDAASTWGEDAHAWVKLLAPGQLDNPAFLRWINRMNRLSVSPDGFREQLLGAGSIVSATEPHRVGAPTIIVHLRGDRLRSIGNARALAELIPNSKLVEIDGADHLMYATDNWRQILDPVIEFFTGTRPPAAAQRRFAALMFADIVGSDPPDSSIGATRHRQLVEQNDAIFHRRTAAHGGRVIRSTRAGILASFDSASAAVRTAQDIRGALAEVGLGLRAGIHAGEVDEHANGEISGIAVALVEQVTALASNGTILLTSTTRDLLLGTAVMLEDRGIHDLPGIEGAWHLHELS